MAGAIEDRPRMIPIADAPSNGTQFANSNVQQPSSVPPARVQPANPPSALSTPAPYANMSPLQDAAPTRLARSQQTNAPYGPSRSGRSTRRALEYIASPDKETVKKELEEQRVESQRLTEELHKAAQYNERLRNRYHTHAEEALRNQQQEFEQAHDNYDRMNKTICLLYTSPSPRD